MSARVILVDARHERQAIMRAVVEAALGDGTVVAELATTSEVAEAAETHNANCAVLEMPSPLVDGLAAIASLRDQCPSLLIVVCTFDRGIAPERQVLEAGADAYLSKPVSAVDLRRLLSFPRRETLAVG
jgi:DNA-binding NarL/FixJ family response regulator